MNDVHTLNFPNNNKLLITIPNKNGSSTAISMIGFPMLGEFKYRKARNPIMNKFNWKERQYKKISKDEWELYPVRVAILRDPIKRFISCYNDRVVNKNKNNSRNYIKDFDFFINNIVEIQKKFRDINNHSRAQYLSIGEIKKYTHVYTIDQLDTDFKELIETHSNTPCIPLYTNKHSKKAPTLILSDDQISKIKVLFAQDYKLYGSYF
jgi:hypothetical protein